MDDFLHEILESTKKMFPGATSVNIIVTSEDVKATASYNEMRFVKGVFSLEIQLFFQIILQR